MQIHGGNIYQTARRMGWNWREVLDLSASINPLGVSPRARRAIRDSMERVAHYPENGAPDLRQAAARRWEIGEDQILAGNGATDLIYFLLRALSPRKTLLVTPTFSEYRRALTGSTISTLALERCQKYQLDFARLSRKIDEDRPDLLILTHPNNPTGATAAPDALLRWLLSEVSPETAVLLDESFIDFTGQPSVVRLAARRPRLFVLRSLTKFYALPGLRVGLLVAEPDSAARLETARQPWAVNALAERAAIAALEDTGFHTKTLRLMDAERLWVGEQLREIPDLDPVPTAANFFFAHTHRAIVELEEFLLARKVLVRNCTGMEGVQGEALRFALRTRDENARFVALLKEFYC